MSKKTSVEYKQLIETLPVGICQLRSTATGKLMVEYANRQFAGVMGVTVDMLYENPDLIFQNIRPNGQKPFMDAFRNALKNDGYFNWEGRIVAATKESRWVRITAIATKSANGDQIYSGVQIDITEQKQIEDALRQANTLLEKRLDEIEALQTQLQDHAMRDYLTGLFNRRYLDETMERELARARRENRNFSVVMIDIDQFKSINDAYGHQVGDNVLIALGKLLTEGSRRSDIACRYGGDEFMVVMLNASANAAYKRAEEWRLAFAQQTFDCNGSTFATTLSMGIATYPLHGNSPRGIFQAADQALYISKNYNNRVTISRRFATGQLGALG